MSDLERAKELLRENPALTCAFVYGGQVDTSELHGVKPLLERLEGGLNGWAAADRVVGRGAALLYVLLGVKELYAEVLSRSAEEVLKLHMISYQYDTLTDMIVNRRGDGPCPMEAATKGIVDPQEGLKAIQNKLRELTK